MSLKTLILVALFQTISFSIEKSDFFLGGGFRIISSDIAKYAKHPIYLKLGYIHDITNTDFNLGFEAQGGLGGSSNEAGDSEFIAFWKLQLNTRYDFTIRKKAIIPYINLPIGIFNAGFENNVHPDALAIDRSGVSENETKFFTGLGAGILIVFVNEDKLRLNIEYDYANIDYILAEGNPLGIGISTEYLF